MRRGRPPVADVLTPREWEVWGLLREGLTNAEIAERLGISANTAKYHVAEILGKLGVSTREEAAAWAPGAARAGGFGVLGWVGRWWPAGAGGKAVAGLAAAGVVGAFVLALAMLARQDDASLGKLVWVRDGDLWVRTLPAGEPRRLTSDGGNSLPRWSPSGEWVLYRHGGVRGGQWVMRADGGMASEVDAASLSPASWVPDRDELVVRRRDGAVAVETPEGAEVRVLLQPYEAGDERGWVYGVPDATGKRVVYLERRWRDDGAHDPATPAGEWLESSDVTYSGLGVVDLDGSERRELVRLAASERRQALPFGWADGGQAMLFVTAPIEGGEEVLDSVPLFAVEVESAAVHDLGRRVSINQSGGSGTGERAVVVIGEGRETWAGKRLAALDPGNWSIEELTAPGVAAGWPVPTNDSRAIAYVAAPDVGAVGRDQGLASRRIWVMDADGSNARQVSRDEEYRHEAPRWSGDGRHILFARLTLERCSPSWTLQLLDVRDGSMREVASGLPRVSTYNERPVVGEIPECDSRAEPGSISDTYGNVGVVQAYDWWQPARQAGGG